MISVRCPSCAKDLKVKDELTGKKVKCPGCAQILVVPSPQTIAAPNVENERAAPPQPLASEQATLPPQTSPSESLPTNPSLSKPDATQSPAPDSDHDASLTDFLAPQQSDDELGRLGDFRILKILGHGGMGVVFMGEDPKLGRRVAIKAMLPHLAQSKTSQQRFLREAKAAAALDHDHIVPIFHVGEDRGAPYIVMPFLQGEPLDKVLSREAKLPLAEVLRIGREIARGLAAAHKRGLIHRDIKPANGWLEAPDEEHAGRVKILDFGLARATAQEAGLTQQGTIIGTPAYMSPEQGRGDEVDGRCDLWALGVILYRMSTGRAPFVGKDTVSTLMAVAMNEPPAPITLRPELPQELSDLVMKLLEKDLAKRLGTAAEVVQALTNIERNLSPGMPGDSSAVMTKPPGEMSRVSGRSSPTVAVPSTGPSPGSARRVAFIAAALAGIALLAAGSVFYFQTGSGIVRIEVNDPKIKVAIENEEIQFADAGPKEIRLKPGKHGISITRDDFTFDTTSFELQRGETITLKIDWFPEGKMLIARNGEKIGEKTRAPTIVPRPPPPSNHDFALRFDGAGKVEVPVPSKLAPNTLTVEAWVYPDADLGKALAKIVEVGGATALLADPGTRSWRFQCSKPVNAPMMADLTSPIHLAGVHVKGSQLLLFVDGKLVASDKTRFTHNTSKQIQIGANWRGFIREVRVSRVDRYSKDFTPQQRFEPDKDTIALYHMDEGSGNQLTDSSGNGHHGKIDGARWVKAKGGAD